MALTPQVDWPHTPFGIFLDPQFPKQGRWILHSVLVGLVAGAGAILFDLAFRASHALLLGGIGRFVPPGSGIEGGAGHPPESVWLLPISLVAGGILAGALVHGLAPEAEGHGTDAVIRAFHHLRGKIRRRVPAVKALASAITIGSGGSAGREGPIAQIGAGFGSFLADLLKLDNRGRRILMMAGVAGGIGAIFRAPLGAAFFASECLYSEPEFESDALLPSLLASIAGYAIYSGYAGWGLLFDVPPLDFHRREELFVYAFLGLVCAMAGTVWPRVFYGARDLVFRRLPAPAWTKPAIGGAALGAIALVFPEALGMGYGYIQQAIDGSRTVGFLLAFAAVKILATALTISSGGSGGVFGPSLVIGGALGAAFGIGAQEWIPAIAPEPAACIMVGMCGFFAGVAKAPIASVIMVMEMTGSYGLLVPSLLVSAIAYLTLPVGVRLYENQVPNRLHSPAHTGSYAVDVLRLARVGEVWAPPRTPVRAFRPETPLREILEGASGVDQSVFPVSDASGRFLGEISLEDVRRAVVRGAESGSPASARDLIRSGRRPLTLDDDLATAARALGDAERPSVVVVRSEADPEVLGVFGRRDLILAYGPLAERTKGLPGPRDPAL